MLFGLSNTHNSRNSMAASQSVTADRTGDATSARLMIGVIAAEILTMAGTAAFASTLVELSRLLHLVAPV
jgi:hypothetical protein